MTGLDIAVRASRPRGFSDALGRSLSMQLARNDRLVSEVSSLRAHVARLEANLDGMHLANEQLRADREKHRKIAEALREDCAALVRRLSGGAA